MVDPLEFHTWVKFDFNLLQQVTHSRNGYSAGFNEEFTIVVWYNNQPGPSISEGKITTVVINQFSNIDQIQWIFNTDLLLIRDGDRIKIWDIFENKEQNSYFTTDPILYAKTISLGLLFVKSSGRFTLHTKGREINSQITSDLIMDIPDGVVVYPYQFIVEDGEWVENELGMSWGERGLRRQFEGENDIRINGDLINVLDEDFDDLIVPEGFRYIFDDCGLLLVRKIQGGLFLRTRNTGLLIGKGPKTDAILTSGNSQVLISRDHPYYILRSDIIEQTIKWKRGNLVSLDHHAQLIDSDLRLDNVLPSMYFDTTQDLEYARYNQKHGYFWFPDQRSDYVFYDIYTQLGSIFLDLGRKKHSYIMISQSGEYLLEWNRGDNYPSGTLKLYELEQPEKAPIVLYDEQIKSKRVSVDKFLDQAETDINFPLIIPSWHIIELYAFTDRPIFSNKYSYSQYYLMIERWSQSENAALLDYPEDVPEEKAYLFFGDLVLPMGSKTISFESISPEWQFHETSGLLAFYSADKFCYVINMFDEHLLPVYSFETDIPYRIEFSESGQYLVYLSFEIKPATFTTHPEDGHQSELTTDYPHLKIGIHNIAQQQSSHRTVRFPIFLDYDEVSIKFEDDRILIFYPSYTDNSEESVVMFDLLTGRFHLVNGSPQYRLWMTHSWNSPFSTVKSGEEFPLEPHPEISRDFTMRPFNIYQGALVRKEDNHPISMADINLIKIPQQSTADIYNLDDTTVIEVPFYYEERMKPIHIKTDMLDDISLDEFIVLNRIEDLPNHLYIETDNVPKEASIRRRIAVFVQNSIDDGVVHSPNGISYEHPNSDGHYEDIEYLMKKARLARFM